MTLVSVITPSYNQAQYLEATLRSVLDQACFNPSGDGKDPALQLEYLVVDGGSTDGSVEIIQRYAGRLAWWVSEKDAGQADAINKGLSRARGEVVAWLNSDDLYLPGAVECALQALQADPALSMVYGDALTIDPQGRPLNRLAFGEWGLDELLAFRIICQPAVFMRRAALERAALSPGEYLARDYHYMLDHHLWVRLAQQGSMRHLPGLLAAARQHPGAKNVSQSAGFGRETLRMLAWMRTQPELAQRIAMQPRRVEGGAYRLNARYLLDAGQPAPALREYGRALLTRPGYAIQHWHRMFYALLSLIGVPESWRARLFEAYSGVRQRGFGAHPRHPDLLALPGIEDWPGIKLDP